VTRSTFTLEIAGLKVRLGERTLVMGVLNVTPDSFSDGGLYLDAKAAVAHGLEMVRQGADWIDVGGESTRPGSAPVSAEVELARVLPVIRGLRRRAPSLPISIDTTKSEVAEQAIRAGAAIINDISGLRFDPVIANVAHRERVPLVLMHLRGRPATMQQPPFARSIARSLGRGLAWSMREALRRGVRRSQLLIDPGLGFGKTRRQNFEIIAAFNRLQRFRLPLLVGASRKSFVQAVAAGEGLDPAEGSAKARAGGGPWQLLKAGAATDPATLQVLQTGDAAAVTAAILGGAHVVRVHDVAAIMPAVRIADGLLAAGAAVR
jgi:dihydropteroate synthase